MTYVLTKTNTLCPQCRHVWRSTKDTNECINVLSDSDDDYSIYKKNTIKKNRGRKIKQDDNYGRNKSLDNVENESKRKLCDKNEKKSHSKDRFRDKNTYPRNYSTNKKKTILYSDQNNEPVKDSEHAPNTKTILNRTDFNSNKVKKSDHNNKKVNNDSSTISRLLHEEKQKFENFKQKIKSISQRRRINEEDKNISDDSSTSDSSENNKDKIQKYISRRHFNEKEEKHLLYPYQCRQEITNQKNLTEHLFKPNNCSLDDNHLVDNNYLRLNNRSTPAPTYLYNDKLEKQKTEHFMCNNNDHNITVKEMEQHRPYSEYLDYIFPQLKQRTKEQYRLSVQEESAIKLRTIKSNQSPTVEFYRDSNQLKIPHDYNFPNKTSKSSIIYSDVIKNDSFNRDTKSWSTDRSEQFLRVYENKFKNNADKGRWSHVLDINHNNTYMNNYQNISNQVLDDKKPNLLYTNFDKMKNDGKVPSVISTNIMMPNSSLSINCNSHHFLYDNDNKEKRKPISAIYDLEDNLIIDNNINNKLVNSITRTDNLKNNGSPQVYTNNYYKYISPHDQIQLIDNNQMYMDNVSHSNYSVNETNNTKSKEVLMYNYMFNENVNCNKITNPDDTNLIPVKLKNFSNNNNKESLKYICDVNNAATSKQSCDLYKFSNKSNKKNLYCNSELKTTNKETASSHLLVEKSTLNANLCKSANTNFEDFTDSKSNTTEQHVSVAELKLKLFGINEEKFDALLGKNAPAIKQIDSSHKLLSTNKSNQIKKDLPIYDNHFNNGYTSNQKLNTEATNYKKMSSDQLIRLSGEKDSFHRPCDDMAFRKMNRSSSFVSHVQENSFSKKNDLIHVSRSNSLNSKPQSLVKRGSYKVVKTIQLLLEKSSSAPNLADDNTFFSDAYTKEGEILNKTKTHSQIEEHKPFSNYRDKQINYEKPEKSKQRYKEIKEAWLNDSSNKSISYIPTFKNINSIDKKHDDYVNRRNDFVQAKYNSKKNGTTKKSIKIERYDEANIISDNYDSDNTDATDVTLDAMLRANRLASLTPELSDIDFVSPTFSKKYKK